MRTDEIKKMLLQTSFLKTLSEEELDNLAVGFVEKNYTLGNTVCKAGDLGEAFYIIFSGKARIVGATVDGKETTMATLLKGDHFGEQALLSGEPCELTIRASGELVVLELARDRFQEILSQHQELKNYFEQYISYLSLRNFIKQCTVFSPLTPKEIRVVLDKFKSEVYLPGAYVIREGEEGDAFYLIRSGELEVIKESLASKVVNRLKKGQFFGELALITGSLSAASVRAVSEVGLYRLSKVDFEILIDSVPQLKNAILGVAAGYSESARQLLTDVSQEIGPAFLKTTTIVNQVTSDQEFKQLDCMTEDFDASSPFSPKRRFRFPVLLQQSEMDCGAASLAMICKYHGVNISINRLRELVNVNREGATLYSIAEAAERLGFKTRGIRGDFDLLLQSQLPVIAHWEGNHYIVVYRSTDQKVIVADPAVGLKKLSKSEFLQGWGGIFLLLKPTAELSTVEPSQSSFARFLPYIKEQKEVIFKIFMVSVVLQLIGLSTPIFTQNIVDKVLVQQDTTILNMMLFGMIVIALFQVVTSALRQYMLVFTATQIDTSMMIEFYSHVLGLPLRYFEDRKVGDILSRFNENAKIRDLLTGTSLAVIMDILTVTVYLCLMFYYNAKLAGLALLFIPFFAILTLTFTPLMKKVSRETFQASAESQSHIVESISGISTVKALAVEKPVRWKWEAILQKTMVLQQKGAMIATAADSVSRVLQTLSTTFILWYGAHLVMAGQITVGQLMAFIALLSSVITPILRTVGLWETIQEARIALERLNDVLEAELEHKKLENNLVMPQIKGHIVFSNVTFRYNKEGKNVLQNVNLEISPGQTVALVGRSGSGKSTLANLLLRLHTPSEGAILIDGMDIRHAVSSSLRRQIGVVLQDNFLFSGTIKENIALGFDDSPMHEIMTAAMLAGAHDFISELPMGYESIIGERGMSLSGGQRQRIAIARALFIKPKVLILDEATSALDTESEKLIQQNLDNILLDHTTIVIAHRLSTVRNADQIVVLDRGVIIEKGTHYELMEKKGLYFYLNSQQLQG